jgi:hypothetical protein
LNAGSGRLAKARQAYDQALALCASDPRLYHGLALAQFSTDQEAAKAQLTLAIQKGEFAYPPAWQMWIDLEARKGLSQSLLKVMPRFAERLEAATGAWPDDATKEEFALHLGHVVGFWQGPSPDAGKFKNEVAQADQAITAALTGSRRSAYEVGKEDTQALFAQLTQPPEADAKRQAESADQAKREAERKGEVEKQKFDDNEQKLARIKEEYDKKWEQARQEFEKDWSMLQADWNLTWQNMTRLEQDAAKVDEQINSLQRSINELRQKAGNNKNNDIFQKQIAHQQGMIEQKTRQLNGYQFQFDMQRRQLLNVETKAKLRYSDIQKVMNEYQRATGELVKDSEVIAGKRRAFEKQSERQARLKPKATPNKGKQAASESTKLATYAPLDLQAQRRWIIASYGQP